MLDTYNKKTFVSGYNNLGKFELQPSLYHVLWAVDELGS
jgi:hypothetical protein